MSQILDPRVDGEALHAADVLPAAESHNANRKGVRKKYLQSLKLYVQFLSSREKKCLHQLVTKRTSSRRKQHCLFLPQRFCDYSEFQDHLRTMMCRLSVSKKRKCTRFSFSLIQFFGCAKIFENQLTTGHRINSFSRSAATLPARCLLICLSCCHLVFVS